MKDFATQLGGFVIFIAVFFAIVWFIGLFKKPKDNNKDFND